MRVFAAAVLAIASLGLQACVSTVVGTAVETTGAVAAGGIKATGKVAGATVGAVKDVAR